MVNFGPLTAEIGWRVWGIPANFNGFRVLASLLQRRRSPEANQTLHDVWPSPGLVRYIHFRGLFPPNGVLPGAKSTLSSSCVLLYWQRYCTALQQCASAKRCGVMVSSRNRAAIQFDTGRPNSVVTLIPVYRPSVSAIS